MDLKRKKEGFSERLVSASMMAILFGLFLSWLSSFPSVNAASAIKTPRAIYEHVLYENIKQKDRSYTFYQMTVGARYFTGTQHLVIKVMADSFDSDPDVFISSKNKNPTNSSNAEWYCEREGSETCIVHNGEFILGQTLYIGVACTRACDYKLRAWYFDIIDMSNSERTQMRFNAYTTQILKYYVPAYVSKNQVTKAVEIKVEPEDTYSPIDVFMSMDSNFYLIEEKPAPHVLDQGMGIKFTENDYEWCVRCYIYIILNVYKEQRYYITSQAKKEENALNELIPREVMVNPFTQECFEYYVLRSKEDVRWDLYGYSGHADMYLSLRDVPTSPNSNRISIRGAHGTSRSICASANDRRYKWGFATGNYMLCIYAYTSFSGQLRVTETALGKRFDLRDRQIKTQLLPTGDYIISRYTPGHDSKGILSIFVEVHGATKSESLPKIYYKLCASDKWENCDLDSTDAQGLGSLAEVGKTTGLGIVEGSIYHNPNLCLSGCIYLFSMLSTSSVDQTASFRVTAEFANPGDVDLTKEYQNIVSQGQYITYEINPVTNAEIQPYLSKLKIRLDTLQGDADLFVSFDTAHPDNDQHDYRTRRGDKTIDEIVIQEMEGKNMINRSIFFSVYGYFLSQVKIVFEYEFKPTYNIKLQDAIQIGDGDYHYEYIKDEYDEGFYSFKPWWSGKENRTSIFLCDVIFNRVFFYSAWEQYPKHYATTKHDVNDTIVYYGDDPEAKFQGTFYIRLRPDFALFDLISDRQYIFNMYTFSQAPAALASEKQRAYENLELGIDNLGYSNNSRYQDYRFFQVDMQAVYDIKLTRIPTRGKPIFFVRMMYAKTDLPARATNFHFKSAESPTKPVSVQNLTLDAKYWPHCSSYYRSLQGDGKHNCYLAIGVTCNGTQECAWKLRIEQNGIINQYQPSKATLDFSALPPGPIIENEYINGYVTLDHAKYYYFPLDYKNMGESLVLLNKTQIFGTGANGDVKMLMNIQANMNDPSQGYKYTDWVYPTDQLGGYGSMSYTGVNTYPEIIEPCYEEIDRVCKNSPDGCGLIIGVVGMSGTSLNSYRLKGFYGTNRIKLNDPRNLTTNSVQFEDHIMDYYWFIINDTVVDKDVHFDYHISVGTKDNADPDLYISVYDGREPTVDDYDFKSVLQGADNLNLCSNQTYWDERGWGTTAGVIVVIGVKKADQNVPYTLVVSDPSKLQHINIARIEVDQTLLVTLPALTDGKTERGYSQLFQYYNWEHKDVKFSVDMSQGNSTMMYQTYGPRDYNTNIFTGIPLNVNNSYKWQDVQNGFAGVEFINGSACHHCWFFIRVEVQNPLATQYRLTISQADDSFRFVQAKYKEVAIGKPTQAYIPAGYQAKFRFMLESMDNFVLETSVQDGAVEVYVGLNASTAGPTDYIWKAASSGGIANLNIKQTDVNFHMATHYYVLIKATSTVDSLININLKQSRSVEYVPNNHDYTFQYTHASYDKSILFQKYQFMTEQEHVKFQIFQVPDTNTSRDGSDVYFRVTLIIDSLTPHFYPQIFLKKIEQDTVPANLNNLQYPSIVDYEKVFGDNVYAQLGSQHYEYTFTNVSTKAWSAYTLALYAYSWGLTDQRKPEFQIRVAADIIDKCEAIPCNGQAPVGGGTQGNPLFTSFGDKLPSDQKVMEDGSTWQWLSPGQKVVAASASSEPQFIQN